MRGSKFAAITAPTVPQPLCPPPHPRLAIASTNPQPPPDGEGDVHTPPRAKSALATPIFRCLNCRLAKRSSSLARQRPAWCPHVKCSTSGRAADIEPLSLWMMFVTRKRAGYQTLSTGLSNMAGSNVEKRLVRKLGACVVAFGERRLIRC